MVKRLNPLTRSKKHSEYESENAHICINSQYVKQLQQLQAVENVASEKEIE